MTDIKIPSNPSKSGGVDAAKDATEAVSSAEKTTEAAAVTGADLDSVERIAQDVAAGKIDQDEAVERLLADVMRMPMVAGAPEAMRKELDEMLRQLLADDPHLRSLRAAISPGKKE